LAADLDPTTLATYEALAETYRANRSTEPKPAIVAWLDQLAARLPSGARVLELGSGPGLEAVWLEERGLTVRRTDGARSFVNMMRADGYSADQLDVRVDDLGGPYELIFADAVLLHLTRPEFADVLGRTRRAVVPGGMLAATLKEGDGSVISTERLGRPRRFTYWRAGAVREVLDATGWQLLSVESVDGARDRWLYLLAAAGASRAGEMIVPDRGEAPDRLRS
jgi:predicted TPR repeat methyltransferase